MSKNSSASKIKMHSVDDLFAVTDVEKQVEDGQVIYVSLGDLYSFKNHPFKVKDDEKMAETVESIKANGILHPGLVRKRAEGGYELISGHRRKHACELAGISQMPVIVRELSDDEATIIMVDANLQREHLDLSEQAWSLRMKRDAMLHRGSKGGAFTSDEIGKDVGKSGRTVDRIIRLTELIPELLELADNGKLVFSAAVDISFLNKDEQKLLFGKISNFQIYPTPKQAEELKKASQGGTLNDMMMDSILSQISSKQSKFTLDEEKINPYFEDGLSTSQKQEIIYVALKEYWERRQNCG